MTHSAENDAGRLRTHRLGAMCSECETVLVEADCSCGQRHGYGYQDPNEWAAKTWPTHPCFARVTPPGEEKEEQT